MKNSPKPRKSGRMERFLGFFFCIWLGFWRSSDAFSIFIRRFFTFWGGAFPAFCALPPLFLTLFSSGEVKICDFLVSFLRFLLSIPPFFMDNRCFSLIFYGKRRKQAKKQAKFRRILALFCVFFVFSRFFGLFSWCFFVRFLCLLRRIGRHRADFLRRFLYFFRGIAVFCLLFSFSDFWFSTRKTKKRQFYVK